MEIENNPLLQQEDYWAGYNKSIQDLKNRPEVVALDKLIYEVFEHNEQGKKLLELIKHRFMFNSQISRGSATYQIDAIWQEGFRDAWRMVMNSVNSHQQRIKAEGAKHDRSNN